MLTSFHILGVEGLEFNRRLSLEEVEDFEASRNRNGTYNIPANSLKKKDRKNPSSTFISKKVFIYTDVVNRTEIISRFRAGKFAPKRPVNGVKTMYELVTVGSKIKNSESVEPTIDGASSSMDVNNVDGIKDDSIVTSSKKSRRKIHEQPKKLGNIYAEIEWPGGRKTRTEKISITRESGSPFSILDVLFGDFNDRKELGVQYNVINFMRGKPKKPFNRWVSFASPPDNVASGRSQEYYVLSHDRIRFTPVDCLTDISNYLSFKMKKAQQKYLPKKNVNLVPTTATTQSDNGNLVGERVTNEIELEGEGEGESESVAPAVRPLMYPGVAIMKYKRYGECPSWYSVGRSSASEILGTRYNSAKHIPPHIVSLVNQRCPEFLETRSDSILDDFRSQKDLLEKYRPWYSFVTRRFQRKKSSN